MESNETLNTTATPNNQDGGGTQPLSVSDANPQGETGSSGTSNEGSAEQWQEIQRESLERKQAFRSELEELVEKYQYAPDVKIALTDKGMKAGVVLVDLKNGENLTEDKFPTWEDEQNMRDAMKKAMKMNQPPQS
jgi:hypothetical protein